MLTPLSISGVWTFTPRRIADERGWFSETFNEATLADALGGITFVQDNQSLSRAKGTVRGLHFQAPPRAQDKLVRVVSGSVFDVAVDLRPESSTYGKWVSAILSAENGVQIFVPKGFAHGFVTLEPDTEVLYKVSDFYSREHDGGLRWNDPALEIDWGVSAEDVTISDRDQSLPFLSDLGRIFEGRE